MHSFETTVKHIFLLNDCKTCIPHIANPVHRRTLQIALLQGSHNRGEQIGNHTKAKSSLSLM